MGLATFSTFNTTNDKSERVVIRFDFTLIVTMNHKASGVTAGTCELVKLDAVNTRIIKSLR